MKVKPPLYVAKPTEVATLGFGLAGPEKRCAKVLAKMAALRSRMRSLMVMLDPCTKCGNCARQCHSFLGTEDGHNVPAARADLFRRIYRRHFTWTGRLFGWLAGTDGFTDQTLDQWLTYYYQCNECRRCARFCPFGIDTAEITIMARHILSELGVIPKFLYGSAANLAKTGNNMGIPKAAIMDSAEFMEQEMREETGLDIKIPVDKPDSEILYIPSSADFFTNIDTMIGAAKMFYALGVNWTIASSILEAANFGLLFNYRVMAEHNHRLKAAAAELGAGLVIQGECGHGWRAAKLYTNGLNGPVPFRLQHILEFCDEHLVQLPLKKLPLRVTLHDPCNYVRAGDMIEQPRRILRACVTEPVEMTPHGQDSFCCGGGSGILMDEMYEIRMKLGKKKFEQVRALGKINYVAIPCSICKAQLPAVFKHYGMEELAMGGLTDLVGRALELKEKQDGGTLTKGMADELRGR